MQLYDLEISGNCYKIRLFLSLLGVQYTKISVNVLSGENQTGEFLKLNPNGQVPVLVDGPATIYDSAAILTYLAATYADDNWLPVEPVRLARVIRWLAFEQSEGRYGLARARAMVLKNPTPLADLGTLKESHILGDLALHTLNEQLLRSDWLAGGSKPTICDIACHAYAAMSADGGLSLESYTAVRRWVKDIERLKGYIAPPGKA